MFTIGELFAGIGGFSLAFHAAGARTAWFVEKEPFCQKVLNKNFPGVPVHGDIYECHDLPYVDVITAGFPCQPFSLAGKRQGVNDERYLVPEMLRVIGEVQPRAVVLENVPGFTNIAAGDTFNQLLRALAALGFDAQWGHIRASDIGAPHQRERWFCVAYAQSASDRRVNRGVANSQSQTGQQNVWPIIDGQNQIGTGTPVADTNTTGRREQRRPISIRAQLTSVERSGRNQLGHASKFRRKQYQPFARSAGTGKNDGRLLQLAGTGTRATQRGLGGNITRLPYRLDEHRWPARPGQEQFAWEPPRVISGQPHRTQRLKALGNAVVPQVVYPIACEIVTWLETQTSEEGAA